MERVKRNLFIQLQFSLLLAALTVLPVFDWVTAILGPLYVYPIMVCKAIAVLWGALALYRLYDVKGSRKIPVSYVVLASLGLLLVCVSLFGVPVWIEYLALVDLIIAISMTRSSLHIKWNTPGSQGAYLVLLAIVLHIYNMIASTPTTQVAALAGLVLYWIGLGKMKQSLDADGLVGVVKLRVAIVLSLAAIILAMLPMVGGILSGVLLIVSFVLCYLGYSSMRQSVALGAEGRGGAGNLCASMILLFIAAVLAVIPSLNPSFSAFVAIVSLWLVYLGWTRILDGMETMAESGYKKEEEPVD